jgi:hypothetical protein
MDSSHSYKHSSPCDSDCRRRGVVSAGVAMLVLPGPGILVIIAGLAILAKEFTWAERTLDKAKEQASKATSKVKGTRFKRKPPENS